MPRVRAVFALSALMTLSETGCSESKDLGQPVLFTFGLSPIDGALDACVGGVDGAEGTLAFTNESDWTVRISLSHQSGLAFSPSDLAVAPHQSGRVAWKLTRDVPPFVVSALWDHGWSWNATVPVRASIDESLFRIEDAKVDALGQSPGRVTIANTASISGSVSIGGRGPVVPSQIEVLVAAKSSAEVGYALTREAARGEHGENVEGALQIHAGNCGRAQEMPLADVRVTGRSSRVAKQIVAGRSHTCALADDGSVHCWGSNSESELGIGAKSSLLSRPMPIMELAGGVTALAAGFFQTLALRDGKVFCWGGLSGEACGGISGDAPARPTEVPLPANAVAIHAGPARSCATLVDGRVFCWGRAIALPTSPTEMTGVTSPRALAIGSRHICALSNAGAVSCAGDGGRLGDGTTNSSESFVPIAVADNFQEIVAGDMFTCARARFVHCWGEVPGVGGSVVTRLLPHNEGVAMAITARESTLCLGEGTIPVICRSPSVIDTMPLGPFAEGETLASGNAHVCLLRAGRVHCVGNDVGGMLGEGAPERAVAGFDSPD